MPVELRGSRLPLLLKCAGSAYLPTEEDTGEELERAQEWGKMVHRWKETGEIDGATARSEKALHEAIFASGIDRERLWPSAGHHEQSLALSVDGTRRVVVENVDSLKGKPGWITGTADYYWTLIDGRLWVDDLKTGKYYVDRETGGNLFPQDPRSTQIRFYATGIAALIHHRGDVDVSVTHWPRLPVSFRHSLPTREYTTYTMEELDEHWSELERLYSRVQAGIAGHWVFSPGEHCRFCPARSYCVDYQPPEPFNWRNNYV